MSSIVDICNYALSHLGQDTILALDEKSVEARTCNRFYKQSKDSLLQGTVWSFARRIDALALTTDTHPEWAYVYALPADALKIRYVFPDIQISAQQGNRHYSYGYIDSGDNLEGIKELVRRQPFKIQMSDSGKVLMTDLCEAYVCYTDSIDDTTQFGPLFIDALSLFLAYKMAYPLIGGQEGRAMKRDLYDEYTMALAEARAHDMNNERRGKMVDSDSARAHIV